MGNVDVGSNGLDLTADDLDEVFAVVDNKFEVEGFFTAASVASAGPDLSRCSSTSDEVLVTAGNEIQHRCPTQADVIRSYRECCISFELEKCEWRVDDRRYALKKPRHHRISVRDLTIGESVLLVSNLDAVQKTGVARDVGEQDGPDITTRSQRFANSTAFLEDHHTETPKPACT